MFVRCFRVKRWIHEWPVSELTRFLYRRLRGHGSTCTKVCREVGDSHLSNPLSTAFMELVRGDILVSSRLSFIKIIVPMKYRVKIFFFLSIEFNTALNAYNIYIYNFFLYLRPTFFIHGRTKYALLNSRLNLTLEWVTRTTHTSRGLDSFLRGWRYETLRPRRNQ